MGRAKLEDRKGGFPHSEITGSKGASASPVLIAACHVLHRLSTPRHPSEALQRLIVSQQNSCRDVPADWKEMPAGPCLIFVRQCLLSNRSSKPMNRPDQFFLHNINAGQSCDWRQSLDAIYASPWWSQTESNRRHPACKAGALPTELWPRSKGTVRSPGELVGAEVVGFSPARLVGPGRLELPTSRLSGVRSNQAELRAYGRTTAGP